MASKLPVLSAAALPGVLKLAVAAGIALGLEPDELASRCGLPAGIVGAIWEQADVRALVRRLEDAAEGRIARGAAGVVHRARQEAADAFERLVEISTQTRDIRTGHKATMDLLALGGVAAPKKVIVEHRDAALERFTLEELEDFARTGEWPARLLVGGVAA